MEIPKALMQLKIYTFHFFAITISHACNTLSKAQYNCMGYYTVLRTHNPSSEKHETRDHKKWFMHKSNTNVFLSTISINLYTHNSYPIQICRWVSILDKTVNLNWKHISIISRLDKYPCHRAAIQTKWTQILVFHQE